MKYSHGNTWERTGMESPFATFVKQIYPLSNQAIDHINRNTYLVNVKKGSYLLKSGDISRQLFLIMKGVVRAYMKEGSREITTWINAENEVIASIRGFNFQLPSKENIQALEDCIMVGADYDTLQHMYTTFPEMNIVGRKILEQYYCDAEERAYICRIPNASRRYNYFLETKGSLANRIPLKYIASYLGITMETLSRIRGKKVIS